jgi:hypothetical protein
LGKVKLGKEIEFNKKFPLTEMLSDEGKARSDFCADRTEALFYQELTTLTTLTTLLETLRNFCKN